MPGVAPPIADPPIDESTVVSDDPNWVWPAKQLPQSTIDGSAFLTALQAEFPGSVIVVNSSITTAQPTADWDLTANIAQSGVTIGQRSQELWQLLHEYPKDNESTWNPTAAQTWYESTWLPEVGKIVTPSGLCGCAPKWQQATAMSPPDYSSPRKFARWAWREHRNVSLSIAGHQFATFTWSDAKAAWGYPWGW